MTAADSEAEYKKYILFVDYLLTIPNPTSIQVTPLTSIQGTLVLVPS